MAITLITTIALIIAAANTYMLINDFAVIINHNNRHPARVQKAKSMFIKDLKTLSITTFGIVTLVNL